MTIMCFLLKLSDRNPPNSPINKKGIIKKKPTNDTLNAELVSSCTNQAKTVRFVHLPVYVRKFDTHKSL